MIGSVESRSLRTIDENQLGHLFISTEEKCETKLVLSAQTLWMGKLFVTFGCIFGILTAEDEEEYTRNARLSFSRALATTDSHLFSSCSCSDSER